MNAAAPPTGKAAGDRQIGAGMSDRTAIDLSTRLALGIDEAAEALGISPNLLRDHLSELPKVYFGRRVVIPVDGLREWLASRAEAERAVTDKTADEILGALR
jgi:hypothetical protein